MSEMSIFIRAFLTGVLIAALSDVFEIMRCMCRKRLILINVLDACFWILSAVLFWIMLYNARDGGFRCYLLLGVIAGALWKKELKIVFKKATIKWKDHRQIKEGL